MALSIETQTLPDPPAFADFLVPPNLLGGYFQITGNPARVELVYGRFGQGERLPQVVLAPGSYSVGRSPRGDPLNGIRAQNATAGIGAAFGGYFWTEHDPTLSFIGVASSQVAGAVVVPKYSVAQFQALAGPFSDGQIVAVVVDAAAGIEWLLQWDDASGFWFFAGGGEYSASVVGGTNNYSGTVYGAITNEAGPTLTLPLDGDYLVRVATRALVAVTPTTATSSMSFDIGATAAVDENAVQVTHYASGSAPAAADRSSVLTGITAGTTLTAKYKVSVGTSSFRFDHRYLLAVPRRVTQ